jgi:AmmeMemoRadiSam system protein A
MSSVDLSVSERESLLALARAALVAGLSDQPLPMIPDTLAHLRAPAFVTLICNGELRGCTGSIRSERVLAELVGSLALSSATGDPRFSPLTVAELGQTRIEISVLSTPLAAQPHDVVVGLHGVLVERGQQRALLLPQVATEHRFDRGQLLAAVCRKAGLPPDAYLDGETRLLTFTAVVFGELA